MDKGMGRRPLFGGFYSSRCLFERTGRLFAAMDKGIQSESGECAHNAEFRYLSSLQVDWSSDNTGWRRWSQCRSSWRDGVRFAWHSLPSTAYACRANLAIVDSKVLYEALDDAEGDIDAAAKIFNDRRFNRVRSFQDWQLVCFPLIDLVRIALVHRSLGTKITTYLFRRTGDVLLVG